MAELRAIETRYNGYRFRSRLEARWAVFFDTLGIRYEYEKEGFVVEGTPYLPDFYLPDLDHWVEIKGSYPTEDEQNLGSKFARQIGTQTGESFTIFWGDVWLPSPKNYGIGYDTEGVQSDSPESCHGKPKGEVPYYEWTECPICKQASITSNGFAGTLYCDCDLPSEVIIWEYESRELKQGALMLPPGRRVVEAYLAAREARFEHGEKPTPRKKGGRRQ